MRNTRQPFQLLIDKQLKRKYYIYINHVTYSISIIIYTMGTKLCRYATTNHSRW